MKYRLLNAEEMEIFDEDFKYFLIANGVKNEDWLEMNKSNRAQAQTLVELFSDTVLQKVYEKIKFIEHRSPGSCMVFKLGNEQIDMISINAKSDLVNLSTPESVHEALSTNDQALTMFRTSKKYSKNREMEIHEMLQQGCVNSSEAFWISLQKLLD